MYLEPVFSFFFFCSSRWHGLRRQQRACPHGKRQHGQAQAPPVWWQSEAAIPLICLICASEPPPPRYHHHHIAPPAASHHHPRCRKRRQKNVSAPWAVRRREHPASAQMQRHHLSDPMLACRRPAAFSHRKSSHWPAVAAQHPRPRLVSPGRHACHRPSVRICARNSASEQLVAQQTVAACQHYEAAGGPSAVRVSRGGRVRARNRRCGSAPAVSTAL